MLIVILFPDPSPVIDSLKAVASTGYSVHPSQRAVYTLPATPRDFTRTHGQGMLQGTVEHKVQLEDDFPYFQFKGANRFQQNGKYHNNYTILCIIYSTMQAPITSQRYMNQPNIMSFPTSASMKSTKVCNCNK